VIGQKDPNSQKRFLGSLPPDPGGVQIGCHPPDQFWLIKSAEIKKSPGRAGVESGCNTVFHRQKVS